MDRDTLDPNETALLSPLERLGQALRDARQQQGLALTTLAAKLNMGAEQLSALETADTARLPEPVFVIAQARRVADALGTDVSPLIAALKPSSPEPQSAAPKRSAIPPTTRPRAGSNALRRSPRMGRGGRRAYGGLPLRPLAFLALVLGVAAAGAWLMPRLGQMGMDAAGTRAKDSRMLKPKPKSTLRKPVIPGLVLTAKESSWLEVRQGETSLFKGTFSGQKHFPLSTTLRILAGRPDLVQLSIDGSIPQTLGSIDAIRWVTLQPGKPFKPTANQKSTAANSDSLITPAAPSNLSPAKAPAP